MADINVSAIEIMEGYRARLLASVSTVLDGDIKAFDEAIEALKLMPKIKVIADNAENIADALKSQRWIPVSEKLPSELGNYLVTYRDDLNELCVDSDFYFTIRERFCCYDDIIAWMPLPQPYKAESKANTDSNVE